jgi:hypothetical protein
MWMGLQVHHSGLRVGWCDIVPELLKHLELVLGDESCLLGGHVIVRCGEGVKRRGLQVYKSPHFRSSSSYRRMQT